MISDLATARRMHTNTAVQGRRFFCVIAQSMPHSVLLLVFLQMSAAAFIKGMLDLEGSSLTPILVSLVTKNASMLDAFGKVGSS